MRAMVASMVFGVTALVLGSPLTWGGANTISVDPPETCCQMVPRTGTCSISADPCGLDSHCPGGEACVGGGEQLETIIVTGFDADGAFGTLRAEVRDVSGAVIESELVPFTTDDMQFSATITMSCGYLVFPGNGALDLTEGEGDTVEIIYEDPPGPRVSESGLRRDCGVESCHWAGLGGGVGGGAAPLALGSNDHRFGARLYAGGAFPGAVAIWEGISQSWSNVGAGLDGPVKAFASVDGVVNVGGAFGNAGGSPAANIAAWDGSTWSPLGGGVNGDVDAIREYDGSTYVAGSFTSAGGTEANRIARWDGSTWSSLGVGLDGPGLALVEFDELLYVGGAFSNAGGVPSTSTIARWDGTTWLAVGSGLPNSAVTALATFDDGTGLALFAAATGPNEILKWDGSSWVRVGQLDGAPAALAAMDPTRGKGLYAGGDFTQVGGVAVNHVARWNGSRWSELSGGMNSPVTDLHVFNDGTGIVLSASGSFTTAGGTPAQGVAEWRCGCCEDAAWGQRQDPTWSAVSTGPSARHGMAMAFHTGTERTVMFGGSTGLGLSGETWEWDGVGWSNRNVLGPTPRVEHEMAFDGDAVLLFGGRVAGGALSDETWRWDGAAWTQLQITGPSARIGHRMAYDSSRDRVVLFGGTSSTGYNDDTWEWDGVGWSQVSNSGPTPRADHAMAYDTVRSSVVLFGGSDGADLGDTWEWDGTSWQELSDASSGPGPRSGAAMSRVDVCGGLLMFGGSIAGSASGDTWRFEEGAWSLQGTSGPGARSGHSLAYDGSHGRVTLFGGGDNLSRRGDTWARGCPCDDDEVATLDANGEVIFPPELDPTEPISFQDVEYDAGYVDELYPNFNHSDDSWYECYPCDQSIGGDVPQEALEPDLQQELINAGVTGVTPEEVRGAFLEWEDQIQGIDAAISDPLPTFGAVHPLSADPVFIPSEPHCYDPQRRYLFGGRDIVFIHGFMPGALSDRILGNDGADATWPDNEDAFFEDNGYWKREAVDYWDDYVGKLSDLFGTGPNQYANRYLVVAWPSTQRLEYAVETTLQQIHRAMASGAGVKDPLGDGKANFGTPSYVIVTHSTGMLVADAAMSAGAFLPNFNASHVSNHAKAHIALHGAGMGTHYAAAATAASYALTSAGRSACEFASAMGLLVDLGPNVDCDLYGVVKDSVLVDIVPSVAAARWGPYLASTPVRTLTVVGGHHSSNAPFKWLLARGFDDGTVTINSQVGNSAFPGFWPAGYKPKFPGAIRIYDMGLPAGRAVGFYLDQNHLLLRGRAAAGPVPWVSPSGMLQPVRRRLKGFLDPLRRYPNHFSYIQSATDHGFDPQSAEDTRVLTSDFAPFLPFSMPYEKDDHPLLKGSKIPRVRSTVKGRKVCFTVNLLFTKFKKCFWIWKRRYHRLDGWQAKDDFQYVFDSVLTDGGYPCPPAGGISNDDERGNDGDGRGDPDTPPRRPVVEVQQQVPFRNR